ncbi:MAG: hypothetical protein R6W89_05020, partial [Candidatus Hydrogenedentota bacterium]
MAASLCYALSGLQMSFLECPGRLPWAIVFQALRAGMLTLWLVVLADVNGIAISVYLGQQRTPSQGELYLKAGKMPALRGIQNVV